MAKLHYKPNWKRQILERLHRKLKKGLDVDNAHFMLLYRLPYNDLNPDVTAKFESNVFSASHRAERRGNRARTGDLPTSAVTKAARKNNHRSTICHSTRITRKIRISANPWKKASSGFSHWLRKASRRDFHCG